MRHDRDHIRQAIRDYILRAFLDGAEPSSLRDDASLERTHVVDSVKTLDLILFLEDAFGVSVDNEDAVPDNFDTVDHLVAYVARKQGALACA
jgi:acyl carrier protein